VRERFETERLTFRPVTLDDVDLLLALDADPEVMRYINGGKPSSRDDVVEVVTASLGSRWLAMEAATGELVGWFVVEPYEERPGERELGYRLWRRAWGRGYATEGARSLIDHAFTRLDAHRIWAETMAVNTASRRVMERCGMRYVRTFHLEWDDPIPGTEHGEVEYEILRPD
jgi:RimJ/RimL family protein N-acetyltransferase